jgi:septum formation protein
VKLVLASTSPYRRELLARLGLPFEVVAPSVDESRLPGEAGERMAARLAEAKARAVRASHPDSLVIGSDQVALCRGEIFGKPGNHDKAVQQLEQLSGCEVAFQTALAVYNTRLNTVTARTVPYFVTFRTLERRLIERYVAREKPFDCAGSAKAEGLGIALIQEMKGSDPTALMGLPLIALVDLLREHGLEVI